MIDIQLDDQQFCWGDTLSGQFIWQSDNPDKIPKSADVLMNWFTEGRGTGDRQTVEKQPLSPQKLLDFQTRPFPFSFTIPREVPMTYDGYLFRLMWELEVKIVFPGIFRPQDRATCVFQVLPYLQRD
ncbi:MAG: hypothetical protein HC799_15150 [Limnothrix sp. RL_2_0]|nr:hypothetical protein [Limnothrix sp. RL_2_0]